ncbi:MAG: DUF3644 domain-containing protein [Melioribacteraceae bacterium]|nr:DUF3644 domain-containing protein [Melioribacteraceae bacterium]MCF8396270.1 DUF3644 domain-containing protein [Melioribacteraceae bacterium]
MRGLPLQVKELLTKARESALLAVEIYNKPAVKFKTGAYISLMIIAWTALFHAYYLKKRTKPYFKKGRRFEKIIEKIGNKEIKEYKWWDLSKCIKEYFKGSNPPERKNLEFFIPLRNMIEHRNLPELDISIFGECQSLITNFDDFIENVFGRNYMLGQNLSHTLQFSFSQKNLMEFSRNELKKKSLTQIVNFIKSYRSSLSTNIFQSDKFSYKVVLIKVGNHSSRNALPLKFVNYNDLSEEDKKKLQETGIVLTREKEIKIPEDRLLKEYKLQYEELCSKLKDKFPSFKRNPQFYSIKREIIANKPNLVYSRRLDPKNLKSQKKDFYHPNILKEFEKYYSAIN